MKVFVGCTDIAGFQSRAARALARCGHRVHYLNVSPHPYNPDLPDDAGVVRVWPGGFRLASRLRSRGGLWRLPGSAVRSLLLWAALLKSVTRTDVYLFAGRRTFFSSCFDLRLLRLLGKRVVHVFLGSDSRPAYLGSFEGDALERTVTPKAVERIVRRVQRQRRRIGVITSAASEIIENPLCAQFHTRRCVNWYRIGFPLSTAAFRVRERLEQAAREEQAETVRVLHCPSKLGSKGTKAIEECIERLRREGLAIDYIRITKMPHAEVLDQIARCDLVVDQLYSDSALAGFASEAAIFGKPAVVGGYGWEVLARHVSDELLPPSATCRADELYECVKRLVTDPGYRQGLGASAQAFVEKEWSEEAVGEHLAAVMEGSAPDEWYFDPTSINYVEGAGMELGQRRELVRGVLERGGRSALGLEARPELLSVLERFVDGSSRNTGVG